MFTVLQRFPTRCATTFLHEFFSGIEAFADLVTNFRAVMSARKCKLTSDTTRVRLLIAIGIGLNFFTTGTNLSYLLKAWRAISCVTLQGALMPTRIDFLASV